jgi:hypothetical protein
MQIKMCFRKKDLSVERTLSLICSICLLMVSAKTCFSQKEFTCLIGNVCLGLFGNCGDFWILLKFFIKFSSGEGFWENFWKFGKAQKRSEKSSEKLKKALKERSYKTPQNSYQIHKQTLNNSDCC